MKPRGLLLNNSLVPISSRCSNPPRGHSYQKNYGRVITVGKEPAMKKSVVMMLFLALFAAMVIPEAGIGPVQTQACGTDKPPPPPG